MKMELIADCSQINIEEWHELMKYTRKCSGRYLRAQIKRYLPELYEALQLQFYNPYECQCRRSSRTGVAVYVHSATEYFIRY